MKHISIAAAAAASMLVIGGCTTMGNVTHKEDNLSAAGFVERPANTPQRQEMLAKLPPHRFVRRVRGDQVNYVFADPSGCNCLYVGSQRAYGRYRREMQRENIADENAFAAQEYSDPAWNWGIWGGFGPGFGYGPGFGW